MSLSIEDSGTYVAPARGRLMGPALVVLGLLAGGGAAVGFLLWFDQARRDRFERERVEALAELDKRAKAAKVREDVNSPKDPLVHFNEQFRKVYRNVRDDAMKHTSPVILVSGDELVLFRNGNREPALALPPLYHQLKTYAHVPLAAYLVTALEAGNTDLPAARQLEMKEMLERLPDLRQDLAKRNFSDAVRKRQETILDVTIKFLESSHKKAFEKQPIDAKERREFALKLKEPILANVQEAAAAQIAGLDKQVEIWRKMLSADEWKRLKVVVVGSAMPRRKNVAVQYFAWLLNEPADDRLTKRIVYAENLFDESRARDLLGAHLVDEDIGRSFFEEPSRMRRDLLGDAAEQILEAKSKKSGG